MAMKKSITAKLGRIRPPRVHITYDVETGGAIEKREIPFVVGVMADLSAQPDKPLAKLKDRKFTEIDRDNFDQVMAKQEPRLAFKVDNTLTPAGGKLGGVMADLSAQSDNPATKLKERKFTEIDRDKFDQVMAKQEPRLAFKVDNTLTPAGALVWP